MVCARCAREIDDSLAVCPICGLDQHRPGCAEGPTSFWGRVAEAYTPYGDDDWTEEGMRRQAAAGRRPYGYGQIGGGWRGWAIAAVTVAVLTLSFIAIWTVGFR